MSQNNQEKTIILISQTKSPVLNEILKTMEGHFVLQKKETETKEIEENTDHKKIKKVFYQGRNYRIVAHY